MLSGLIPSLAAFVRAGGLCLLLAPAAVAATNVDAAAPPAAVSVPADLKPQAVEGFVAPLTDVQARNLLITRLKAETAPQDGPAAAGMDMSMLLSGVDSATAMLHARSQALAVALVSAPAALRQVAARLAGSHGSSLYWLAPLTLGAMLLAGYAVERLVGRGLGNLPESMRRDDVGGLSIRLSAAAIGLALASIRLLAFTVAAYAASLLFMTTTDPLRRLLGAFVLFIFVTRLIGAIADALLAPGAPKLRLLALDQAAAVRKRRRALWIGGLISFAAISHGMLRLLGLPPDLLRVYALGFGLVVSLLLIGGLAQERHRHSLLLAQGWPRLRDRLLTGLLVAVMSFAYLSWSANILLDRGNQAAGIALGVIIILLVPGIDRLLGTWRERGVLPEGDIANAPTRRRGLMRVIGFSLHLLATITVLVLFANAGGLQLFAWLETPTGIHLLRATFQIGITLLLAAVGWQLLTVWIDRQLSGQEVDEVAAGSGASRAQTLLPLLRNFLLIGMIAIVGMIVLSAVGVDIGPLLAGAGVVGLAIGFGAQTLVRDIVSGVFFLVDDAFRIGEYIEMGNIRGEVEKISIRSLTLRHHRGALHTVPFGELKSVTNYNRDWVIYKFSIGVTYDTDINRVKKIIKEIGAEMAADPEMARNLLEPLKSQGVTNFADSSMTVRVKFKCKPREQFVLRRFAMQRIKEEFDKAGIQFAFPHVVVKAAGELPAGAAAAAAAAGKPTVQGSAAAG